MKKLNLILITFLLCSSVTAQEYLQNFEGDYFGQETPQDSAIMFAPEIVSVTNRYEYGLAISPNHDEYFFTSEGSEDSTYLNGLLSIKRIGDKWLKPQKANLNQEGLWEQEAFFSPDGKTIYYAVANNKMVKLWKSEKIENGWSKGIELNSPVNDSSKIIFYATFSDNDNMYYTNVMERKVFMSPNENGEYNKIIDLGLSKGGHGFIAPDESFILIDASGDDSFGKRDIFVAFKTENGKWDEPINLGKKINTKYSETCPSLSPDGKYLFFGRYNDENEKSNIYWISSKVIKELMP